METQMELLDMKNAVYEIKNLPDGINSRLNTKEEKISKHENRVVETIEIEIERGKKDWKNLQSLIDLWKNIKQSKNCVTKDTKGQEKKYFQKLWQRFFQIFWKL